MSSTENTSRTETSLEDTPIQSAQDSEASRMLSQQSGEIPAAVAGYEVIRCLGQGSFGAVWLAREKKTSRLVAIKFFTNRRGLDWTLLTREVEKLAVLDASRDVVRLLDVGWDHTPPYFVMEYLQNSSVSAVLENGAIPVERALEITAVVARALIHAHGAGILHCDIKPANILLDANDEARLSDFGQSRMSTEQSAALGTFFYMAPEQAQPRAVPDVRWDVYALGAVLYHMVTGSPPYRTPESEQRLTQSTKLEDRLSTYTDIIKTSPIPTAHRDVPGVDRPLVNLIDHCLARDPAERLPNTQKILDAIVKREKDRARRPLILLGVLGPVLFFLLMIWAASNAVPKAVREAENHLSQRALTSDVGTVQLLASSIQQEITDRQHELERLARQLPNPDAEAGEPFHEDLEDIMQTWWDESRIELKNQRRTNDQSLFVTNHVGTQLYRLPVDGSIGGSFWYRDYFHGLGIELAKSDDPTQVKPRETAGVSLAFRSVNTQQFMVAIAVPIRDADENKVIGVVARTIHLSDLLSQWEERISDQGTITRDDRAISLIDLRESKPYLLDHDWMTRDNLKELGDDAELKEMLQLNQTEEDSLLAILNKHHGQSTQYLDPLADEFGTYDDRWLAAVARVGNLGWVAVVQERRQAAVAPMSDVYWVFLRYGAVLIVVFLTVLSLLWWLIQRAARAV